MSKNNSVVPQARAALDQFKMEAEREVGIQSPLKENIHMIFERHAQLKYKYGRRVFWAKGYGS